MHARKKGGGFMKKRLSLRKAKIIAMLDYSCGINIAVLKLNEYGFKVSDYFKRLDEIENGDDFEKGYIELQEYQNDVFHKDDELYDINFGVCCFTINNEKGKGFVNNVSIEVYDSDIGLIGNYTANELAEKGGIKD